MDTIKNIIFGILLLLVLIFIILLIVFSVKKSNIKNAMIEDKDNRWPPENYMEKIGVKCPDYWEDLGPDPNRSGYHICQNSLNVPVNSKNESLCYDNKNLRRKSFRTITWKNQYNRQKKKIEGKGVNELCNWTTNCGPTPTQDGSWIGINTSNGYTDC